jgi:FO synthase
MVSIRTILDEAAGGGLNIEGACRLLDCEGEEAQALIAIAGSVRDRFKGRTVTYSRKVFLPITNLCRDRCAYCTFRKDPSDPEAWTMSPEDIQAFLESGRAKGCKEALMCLGDRPEEAYAPYREELSRFGHRSTVDYVYRACEMALEAGILPHTNAGVLSHDEMRRLKAVNPSLGLMLENISVRLRERGQAHYAAPDKEPSVRLRMLREAGELAIPFTTGILIGIGETRRERVESLLAIRDIHEQYGHIQEVIIQSFRAKPYTRMSDCPEPDGLDLAKTIAVARLLLGRMNLQAPPNLSPADHRLLLRAGINDWGGISPVTRDFINPEAAWPHVEDLSWTCREAGFALAERLAIYPEYIGRPGFLPKALRPLTERLAAACTSSFIPDTMVS